MFENERKRKKRLEHPRVLPYLESGLSLDDGVCANMKQIKWFWFNGQLRFLFEIEQIKTKTPPYQHYVVTVFVNGKPMKI